MAYQNFSVDDFLNDDFFISWVLNPDSENELFWTTWQENNLSKRAEIQEARDILLALRFKEEMPSPERISLMLSNIHAAIDRAETAEIPTRTMPVWWYSAAKVAASLLLLLGIGWWLFEGLKAGENQMELIAGQTDLGQATETLLLLSDNRVITLKNEESAISYDSSGRIQVGTESVAEAGKTAYNTLVVPYGKRSMLTLQDGTKVWVNSGSKLVYPVTFASNERRVYLEGEAYFDVTHDANKEFLLETKDLKIRVLGTGFNVSAYANDHHVSAVLVNGSIELTANKNAFLGKIKKRLVPNNRAVYSPSEEALQVTDVDVEKYVTWKEGYLVLRRMPLAQLLTRLERYYDIKVDISEPTLGQETFTGRLDLKQDLEEVISTICAATSLHYTRTGRSFLLEVDKGSRL